ncbi:MAG TPA: tetratricopeptide repeat protein [Acidobacteriaceae bacterium]|jgi:tetratricopeptide (TPR) repeat protein|nr:tetratricopeptide repeat protein [Acidobacteriaceae bacterium]
MKNPSRRLLLVCTLTVFSISSGLFAQSQNAKPAPSGPAPAAAPNPPQDTTTPDTAGAYYHYMLAHEYQEMATTLGRSEYATRAIEEYKMALNDDASSKFLNSHLAELYFRTGRIKEAVVAAQDRIKQDPNDLDAHRLLAEVYLRSLSDNQQQDISGQMLKLAIGEYQKIVQLAPGSTDDHLMLARLYAADHDSVQAEAQLAAARRIDPGSEETALIANRFYSDMGDSKHAIDVLKSLPEDDQTSRTEFQLGATYDEQKDTKDAIASYKKALALEPDNLDIEKKLAEDLQSDNQGDAALQAWKDVATGDPTDGEAQTQIAEIDERNGKLDDALAAVKKARELAPDSLEDQFDEARIQDALGHLDDAAKLFEQLAAATEHPSGQYSNDEKGNYALILDRLAGVYREQNRPDQAVVAYQKMLPLGGDLEEHAYDEIVETWREAHEYDKAVAAAHEAVDKQPKDIDAGLTLARQLADTSHADEGVEMAKGLLASNPKNMEIYFQLSQIYTDLRRWKEASDILDAAEKQAAKKDDQTMILFDRAMMADRAHRYDEAEAEFRKVLADDPNNALTLNNFGFMLADRGVKLDEALDMIRKAVQLEPTNYAYLDSLGWAYYRLGQYTQAEDNLERAIARGANDPTVHDHLGDVYEKVGRLKLAAAQWEISLNGYAHTVQADMDTGDIGKVQKKLDSARVRLAKESGSPAAGKPE